MISFIRFRLITGCGWVCCNRREKAGRWDRRVSCAVKKEKGITRKDAESLIDRPALIFLTMKDSSITVFEKCSNLKLLNHGGR